MRTTAAIVAAGALVAVSAASGSSISAKPSLKVLDLRPLTLQGRNFGAGESVRVQALGRTGAGHRVSARAGSFIVRFTSITVRRCESVRAVAIGAAGSRATLKYLPPPLCKVDLRPGGEDEALSP